ncbi:glycosyltransferase family 2 protein [Nostoc sp. FACHB-152]|uniref:glycosyltransferase n=1 Tax=unclassified Nostoc TaxID=2593658 RepID=UPI00168A1CBD|nr:MULTISPECIES: glycosyltransferase family 2 protein [unclassified Nostoc]MBD2445882.1 glycosyltransferase family 2 protein [Nostoc sp. FACHB-152]MBD2467942.1 glycosyltransferase family 2 protein [Nostoc sp. FACHB-145]
MSTLVSVIIPVKNGQEFLDEVLTATLTQKTEFKYEVVVIDSGSKDNSLEIIKKHNVKLIQIPPAQFNHGLTRNLGVQESQGEFIAFITQDATPANEYWLSNLVKPFLEDPQIAGVFGKHIARPKCDPIVAFNLDYHFEKTISLVRKTWKKDESYESNKGIYVFFSNNNSCIRKSVWEKIPFRQVEMSEDQIWAQDILEQGYIKCYEPSAVVYHSHTYSPIEWFKRSFDEYRAYIKIGLVQKDSILSSFKTIYGLSVGDIQIIRKNPELSVQQKYYWMLMRVLNNMGRISGQFLGVRHDKIPDYFAQMFFSGQAQKMRNK